MTNELTVDDAAQVRLWHQVSQFIFREARLLDEWRLTEWYDEMLTDDIRYVVPATDVRGESDEALGLIDDDAARLRQRIKQILDGEVWCENPRSRTNRIVSNVEILADQGSYLEVAANVVAYRFGHRRSDVYVGKYRFELVPRGGSFRIRKRVVVLDHETLYEHGKLSIVL
ncbi:MULTISPECIES: aromatic-ring-hydroxylating dioxygenase subunit beta [Rhodococcus]|uniref:Aromatic-ring-hydroxylating dioxygenase subunit beta n=1 Tax=Rhodococcus qingshengii TaxID=334542 RepID=A0AAW6LWK0_RHOSG|nr:MULTISPECIES: aromatic-ring-hydroxylating dioxygenase subunit beta [Rhodococcus]ARE38066.1 p-cumate dioxygenase [Rhodococcus sp. BH4]MBQ9056099.1 aromatic-ring-hydroxylating dioxygenase subunit beta [Rhodococcus sp. (in: high G+C Gram-positive bacteria)]MDE8649527.1 aromatic-ring-hydroxylating dioxygenase subunit beta [Rhodococcus qingshengii]MDN3460916.1 aromatic-ring-hydroxylating dioxygenase subunit beta [Rhodococcus sp. APC 3903]OMQ29467.1 p-cumate dioxygenase [Rhodococcus sp. D-1]